MRRFRSRHWAISCRLPKRQCFLIPLNAQHYFGVGNIACFLPDQELAGDSYQQAVFCSPARAEYLQQLGIFMAESGQQNASEKLLQSSLKRGFRSPDGYRRYAAWLFRQNRMDDESMVFYQKAIDFYQSKANLIATIEHMEKNGISRQYVVQALPLQAGINDSVCRLFESGKRQCAGH